MKATGIVRKVDDMGRIVLPIELRRSMDIEEGTPLEIYVEKGRVVLRPCRQTCIFCGGEEGVAEYKNRNICAACRQALARIE